MTGVTPRSGESSRRRRDWFVALGSTATVLLAVPFGWFVLLVLTVPADRGEGDTARMTGIVAAVVWVALVAVSAGVASNLPRGRRAPVFLLGLAASLCVTGAPLVFVLAVS
jgi:hypothetical protein